MYGPPPDCKGIVGSEINSLRKCIRPLIGESFLRAHDDDPRVPVLITVASLVEFIFMPAWRFAAGNELADSAYVRAMFLTLIGFAAFWGGSLAFMKETRFRFDPRIQDRSSRVAFMSAILFGLGLGTKLVLWKAGLFSYAADAEVLASSFAFVQWLNYLGGLLDAALLVSAIEVFGKRSTGPFIKIVFWLSLVSSVGFGLISGTKGAVVAPFVLLVVIYSIANARIPRLVLLLPLLPVMIYPFSNAYRSNLNSGYHAQVNTIEGQGVVLEKSFADVFSAHTSKSETAEVGFSDTTSRLSYLSYLRDVVNLPDPSVLNTDGDIKIWEAPFYPLVPRFLWKDKPIDVKGLRLTVAKGKPATSWSSPTPIGDLYSMYGTNGVVVGMFIYGICMQLYMNRIALKMFSERELFVYVSMLLLLISFELDVAGFVAGVVQLWILTLAMSYIIYGRSVSSSRVARNQSSVTG